MVSNDDLVDRLVKEGILSDDRVIKAMREVDRADFVPVALRDYAYKDFPLSIGEGQTISAPHMVALMSEYLHVEKGNKVFEVGSGSGYQAAVLSKLVGGTGRVFTMERVEVLADNARRNLGGFDVVVLVGDGSEGFPEEAPFDRIVVTCASVVVPEALKEQLAEGGRMVLPLGKVYSRLVAVDKNGVFEEKDLGCPCSFVPLVD